MSYGFIDSASIINAISALTCHKSCEEWGEWEWKSITEVTEALCLHRLLKIAPGPSASRLGVAHDMLYTCYDLACEQLGRIVEDTSRDVRIQEAQKDFRDWLPNNVEYARGAITETKREKGYLHWEQWAIEHAWVDHSYRLNGLFNAEMIDDLTLVLEVQSNGLKKLWKKTTDLQQVKKWSQGRNLDGDFELARDAFVASAILRGGYHDFISSKMGWQIMHHPIRQHILIPLSEGTEYRIPKAIEYLALIIAKGAMEELKPKNRILCWTENIRAIQEAYWQNAILEILDLELGRDEALELVKNTAKKLHLRVWPRSLEKLLEFAIMSSAILPPSLLVLPWPWGPLVGGGLGAGTWILGVQKPLGKRAAEALKLTKGHLRELATSKPGRIVQSWK